MLAIILLLIGGFALWRALSLPASAKKPAQCGWCGYPPSDLDRPCPECGSDLRLVGVMAPALAIRLAPATATILGAWLFLTLGIGVGIESAAWVARSGAGARVSWNWSGAISVSRRSIDPRQARDRAYTVEYDLLGSAANATATPTPTEGTVEFLVAPARDAPTLAIDVESGNATIEGVPISTASAEQALEEWAMSLGLDPSIPEVSAELDAMLAVLESIVAAPSQPTVRASQQLADDTSIRIAQRFASSSSRSGSLGSPRVFGIPVSIVGAGLALAVGLPLTILARRRRVRRAMDRAIADLPPAYADTVSS